MADTDVADMKGTENVPEQDEKPFTDAQADAGKGGEEQAEPAAAKPANEEE